MIQSRYEIAADAQDLRIRAFELVNTSLVLRQFARSTTREGRREKCQDDVLLPLEIRESNVFVVVVFKGEVGSHIADFKLRMLSRRLLSKQSHRGKRK
jgi:hypothetical protein